MYCPELVHIDSIGCEYIFKWKINVKLACEYFLNKIFIVTNNPQVNYRSLKPTSVKIYLYK